MSDPTKDRIERACHLARADDPLLALDVLSGAVVETEEEGALRRALEAQTAHLASRDDYAAFYNAPAPERPYMPLAQVPRCHETMLRWGLVRQQIALRGHKRVLELGCFDGFTMLNLALAGVECLGVDINADAIAEARRRAAAWGCPARFDVGMIEEREFAPVFDAVLLLEVLEHVRDVAPCIATAERALAPGGVIYVSAPLTAAQHTGERERREHVRLLDYPRMRALLDDPAAGRRLVWYQQFTTPDGWHHAGGYQLDAVPSGDMRPQEQT